jgi:transposase InsO family protein
MGQVLHGSARTTTAIRRALQRSEESVRALAKRYGISPTRVQKWRKRETTADRPMGPAEPHSTVLTLEQEAMIVAFRRHTLLPLDDCLYALQPSIPGLTRSSLHRCLQRHGLSRLPDLEGDKPARRRFRVYPIGFFHMDIAEVRTGEGKLYLFVAIDRTSKSAVARLYDEATRPTACQFLQELLKVVPYRIHTLLTDNGIQFAEQPRNRNTILSRQSRFDMICEANGIEHRLTKPNHPWTNGQVERMNRTIKDATTKRYHYDSHKQLEQHLDLFLDAYNHARRLKTLTGLTPAQFICKEWQSRPNLFHEEPCHLMAGLNTLCVSTLL